MLTSPQHLINTINEGVIQIDLAGNILFANHKLGELSGYDYEEVIGKNAADFMDTENLKVFNRIISDRKKGLPGKNKLVVKTKTGAKKTFLVNGSPLKNTNGKIVGSIGTFTELPATKQKKQVERSDDFHLSEILNTINVAFWIFSISTRKIEFLSPGVKDIFETDIEDIYKLNSIKKFIHPKDVENVILKNRENLHSGKIDIQYRIITSGGKTKWIQDKATILKNENGKAEKIIGYSEDITKLKYTKENLIRSEGEKESIMQSIPHSFLTVNSDQIIIKSYFKPTEKALLVGRPKLLVGKNITKVFNPTATKTLQELLTKAFKLGESIKTEHEVRINDQNLCFEITIKVMNGDIALLMLRNITASKSHILKIQKLFNITEQTQDLIVITDSSGKIEYVNPMFTKVTGYGSDEVSNVSINILKSYKHTPHFYKGVWRTLWAKKPFKANFINRKKTGELYIEEKIITPFININGEITNFISTGRVVNNLNLTQSKMQNGIKAEFKLSPEVENNGSLSLIQKQESDQKNLAKKIHEGLNQMLSAVRMNLESLNINGVLNKNERKKIDFVSEVLSEIIQELRGISSYLSPFTLYEYGLYNCICQLVIKLNKSNKLTRFIMNSNLEGIRFKTEIEINYYRIIQELIANALNHSKANNVEINLFYNKGEFKLEIKDDGVGISKRSFNKIKMQKLGIQNIEERAKSIKSNLLFKTKPGNGFEIILKTKTKPINYD